MSRNTKIVLVVASTLLISCCLLAIAAVLLLPQLFSNAITQDPQKARQIGRQIADYTLPPDYREEFGMDVFTTKMVAITRSDERGPLFMLMQFSTAGLNREQMEQQVRQSFQNQFQRGTCALTAVGTQTATIKGETVTLTISEGNCTRGGNTVPVRQALGFFRGKGGTAIVMVYASKAEWDKAAIDRFFQSIQ